ncbi:hypothetical protein HMPREF3177_07870 [Nosocomiicoccus sp. HMSC09A07]|nr:hypothetical protein HMPREF3177_07870 [Nosocomiicoccus sp. HMSC09A07]
MKRVTKIFVLALTSFILMSIKSIGGSASEYDATDSDFLTPNAPPSCYHSGSILNSGDDRDLVTINCSSMERWLIIRNHARLTNKTSTGVYNYVRTGGSNQALRDFNSMPGKTIYRGDGIMTRTSNGLTITYYPQSSSGQVPTLAFPHNKKRTDKIRYEK